jgi:hypothetical protein
MTRRGPLTWPGMGPMTWPGIGPIDMARTRTHDMDKTVSFVRMVRSLFCARAVYAPSFHCRAAVSTHPAQIVTYFHILSTSL